MKYDPSTKQSAIKSLKRGSSPGLRQYTGYKDMPRVINGLGIAILSTSKGVMTNKEAADLRLVVRFFATFIGGFYMSRIGKLPISIPAGVTVSFDKKTDVITVKRS